MKQIFKHLPKLFANYNQKQALVINYLSFFTFEANIATYPKKSMIVDSMRIPIS